jgi:UDP-2,3-diacylglucosamine hydrolase
VSPALPPLRDVPPMTAPVVVAGDVHLSPLHPEVAGRFLAFLEGLHGRCATLVLLGDVFDYWVGRRQARDPFERAVIAALAALGAAGTRLAFQGGNRDYAFDGADGLEAELWPDVVRTSWGERRVLLTHGDLLCSGDVRYQRMRGLLRSAPARGALRGLPYGAARWIARGLRDLSERETRRKAYASMGLDYGIARAWLEAAAADLLVAGHVHTGVHHRLPGDPRRDVLVLKDWESGGGVVVWDGRGAELRSPDALARSPAG